MVNGDICALEIMRVITHTHIYMDSEKHTESSANAGYNPSMSDALDG